METRKLYYEDCHLREFDAAVVSCQDTGAGYAVALDATTFYPEGGGQPCDLGMLGDAQVLYVKEQAEQVIHLCNKALPVGEKVSGQIDWERRFALMQQHTGEHIVSGIVNRRFGWHNVGFHMGSEVVTIDFDGPIPAEALAEIEREANETLWQDLPVRCWYPSEEELPTVGYRTKKQLPWPVRIVEIPGADNCACCGVHVKTTGQVGLIKLFSCVKFHQGVRIEMACGTRALALLSSVWEQNRQVSQAFSAKLLETGAAARKMNETLAQEKYKSTALQRQLLGYIARDYAGKGNVAHLERGLTPALCRELAEAIAGCCGGIAAVLCGEDGALNLCLACPGADVKAIGQSLTARFGGKGGGKPGFFQGSIPAQAAPVGDFLRETWQFLPLVS